MKKIFSFLAAAAMLFAASCSNEDLGTNDANDTQVTFNLSLEGQSGTRTIGDGADVTKLFYYIFDAEGKRLNHYDYAADFSTVTPKIQLAKDQRYKAVFWAQKETNAYNVEAVGVDGTVNIKVNYAENANDEARDAFYGVVEFTVTGSERIDVLLTRPFAQLNVGVTAKDYQDAEHSGVIITKSLAKVTGVYNTLNLLDGSVSGGETEEIEFTLNTIPNEKLVVDGVEYEYLSMNYVLVGAKKNVAAEFEFYSNNDKQINFKSGLDVVPVERNYRTNLVGQILTGNLDFNVTIDNRFDGEINNNNGVTTERPIRIGDNLYATLAEAIAAAYDGDVIKIGTGEFVLPSSITTKGTRAGERKLTFEGVGNSTVLSFNSIAGGADGGLNCYADGLSLTFKNLKVVSPNTGSAYTGGFSRAASVVFENCTYEGQYRSMSVVEFNNCTIDPKTSYIYTDYSDATFKNCTFNCSEGKGIQVYNDGAETETTINIENCTFTASKIGYTYDGKPVTAIDINSNGEEFTVNINNTTATGFGTGLVSGNTLWNIKGGKEYITIMIDGKPVPTFVILRKGSYYKFSDAVAAIENNDVIILPVGNYEMPENNFQGKTLTFKGSKNAVIDCSSVDERNQFVTGANLKFEGVTLNFGTAIYMGFANYASLTYKDCAINGLQFAYGAGLTKFENCELNSNGAEHCLWTWGGQNIEFTGCKFTYGDRAVNCYGEGVTTNVYFTNCTFTKVAGKPTTGAIETNSSTLTALNMTIENCTVNEGDLWWISTWDSKNGANTHVTIK